MWLKGDLEIMRRCDLVVVAPDASLSVGTQAEIRAAGHAAIPVYWWERDAGLLADVGTGARLLMGMEV